MSQDAIDRSLYARLREFARRPSILIACDYDGTLAPIVANPEDARPQRESVAALRQLASMADTHVAVISGRSLRDLAALSRLPDEIHLVGSHGSEFDAGFDRNLSVDQRGLRDRISTKLDEIASRYPGATVEDKPASATFHYRNVAPDSAEAAQAEVMNGPALWPGTHVKHGKMVIELTIIHTDKGRALGRLRWQLGVDAVLFAGDDVTDEDAFETLRGPDVALKIGEGRTAALHRVGDTEDMARVLAVVCEERKAWLEGGDTPAIERHSMLSDQRTMAIVTPDARVTWMCHPRADSPAVFAELLGGSQAGYFSVRPTGNAAPISQRYVGNSLVLQTRWSDLTVTDYLDIGSRTGDGRLHETSHSDLVRVLEGSGPVRIEFAPRLDYARAPTRLEAVADGLVVRGSPHAIALYAPGIEWALEDHGADQTAVAEFDLRDGPVVLELSFERDPTAAARSGEDERRKRTLDFWQSWAAKLELPAIAKKTLERSALTLKALCYEPSGAILAAATTSLPECIGGIRNWDYRYCWPRDASLTAAALVQIGSTTEASALLDWLADRVRRLPGPEQLRPLYAVVGDDYLPEAVLPELNGYRGSRPVRIGNAADSQVQLDVFGPIVDLVHRLAERDKTAVEPHWDLVVSMVEAVARRWHEPDHGIWEERRPQRHHVHSKVMCWQAVDRAIRVAEICGREAGAGWHALRDEIKTDVLENGWNEDVGAFTIAYGDSELDAAALHIGLSGLLPADDSRFARTIRAIERELRKANTVYRYRLDDGLPGNEGGFLICTAWLIEAYVLTGQFDDAQALFGFYRSLTGPTGLLAEQFDPESEQQLGNFPQAYSHLGLIMAAIAIDRSQP